MKKLWKISAFALAPFVLMACGNSEQAAGGNASGNGTLRVMLSEEPTEEHALNNALNKWAEETGNKVEPLVVPYEDQVTSFRSMAQNNDLPDLVATTQLTRLYPEEFHDLSDVIDKSMFDQTALQIIAQDDELESRLLIAPNQYTLSNWYYNADAFDEAGIEAPSADDVWTMEEVYDAAAQLQESGAVKYGLAVDYSRARYDNLMYSDGGSITVKEGDEILVNANAPENVQVLETFVEKNDAGILPKVIWTGGSADSPTDYFINGDVGIYLSGTWNYNQILHNADFNFAVMPSPTGSKQQSVISGGSGLAVPENSENQAMAEEFLTWLYEEDNYLEYLESDKGISFIEGVTVDYDDEKVAADYEIIQNEMQNVTEEFMTDHSARWTNYLDSEYRDYLRRAVAGEMTPQEALDAFAQDLSEKAGWEIKE
ncbi:ABC transporter substrate-binding protein [Atopococcus tabaci]|uniref:ABC transporter substrate-binding protein n=1 Tax=Atopococcus tabaci TaxID=269774 RepID=UPI0003F6097D|nr:extracellular solute-binding protein [Atopococcus tabaci]